MEERRKEPRQRTLKGAKIVFHDHRTVLDCTARNLTEEGASLVVGNTVSLPDTFKLTIPADKFERSCRIRWRRGDRVGVEFISKA
jgi:hypothetical protein